VNNMNRGPERHPDPTGDQPDQVGEVHNGIDELHPLDFSLHETIYALCGKKFPPCR